MTQAAPRGSESVHLGAWGPTCRDPAGVQSGTPWPHHIHHKGSPYWTHVPAVGPPCGIRVSECPHDRLSLVMPSECIRGASPGTQSWQKITDPVERDLQGLAHTAVEAEKSHHLPSASWRREARVQFSVSREPMVRTPEDDRRRPSPSNGAGRRGRVLSVFCSPQTLHGCFDQGAPDRGWPSGHIKLFKITLGGWLKPLHIHTHNMFYVPHERIPL